MDLTARPRGAYLVAMRLRAVLAMSALCASTLGCHRSARFEHQVLSKPGVRYRVGALPPVWDRVKLPQNDLAWYTPDTGHALSVNASCDQREDASLEVLTRHLLSGFTERQEVAHAAVVVDEREALRSHYQAKMDGVPVELMLVVLKKDRCVYDFTYVAPLGRYADRVGDLDTLVQGFHTEQRS